MLCLQVTSTEAGFVVGFLVSLGKETELHFSLNKLCLFLGDLDVQRRLLILGMTTGFDLAAGKNNFEWPNLDQLSFIYRLNQGYLHFETDWNSTNELQF